MIIPEEPFHSGVEDRCDSRHSAGGSQSYHGQEARSGSGGGLSAHCQDFISSTRGSTS